jgi:lysyl-tRNA synthetase class 2
MGRHGISRILRAPWATNPTRSAEWAVASSRLSRIIALGTAGYGVATVIRGIWPPIHPRVDGPPGLNMPLVPGPIAAALTVGLGVVVVLLAHGLARRKRRAWAVAVGALCALAVLDGTRPHHMPVLVITVPLLAALVVCRGQFTGRVDGTMRGTAGRVLALVATMGTAVGLATLSIGADRLKAPADPASRLITVLRGFLGLSGPATFAGAHRQTQFVLTMVTFSVIGVAVAGYLLMRSAEPAPHRSSDDGALVDDLLRRFGERDSLGYFARRSDKSVVRSPSGKAAITYRVIAGTAVVSADPLGDPEAWPAVITEYLELCRRNSWVPAVLGCSARAAQTFARLGLSVLEIGDEAVVEVADFSLHGRAMRNVRQMVNRVRRLGYTATVTRLDQLTDADRSELERLSTAWRVGQVERGYSMALGHLGGGDCVVVVASSPTPDGTRRTRALLQFVPWGSDGWSLDLMRRDPTAGPGMNDFLIASALDRAPEFGVDRVSLNFAMLRQAFAQGERLGAGWAARSWAALLRRASRWYQLDSLYRFNAKFAPVWVPRYLCYRGVWSLPRVAYAAMEAEAFVRRPPLLRRLAGTTVVSGDRVIRSTGRPSAPCESSRDAAELAG